MSVRTFNLCGHRAQTWISRSCPVRESKLFSESRTRASIKGMANSGILNSLKSRAGWVCHKWLRCGLPFTGDCSAITPQADRAVKGRPGHDSEVRTNELISKFCEREKISMNGEKLTR